MRNLVLAGLVIFSLASIAEAKETYVFGLRVTDKDYAVGNVITATGSTATIDLGYADGLIEGSRLWVFRDTGNRQRGGFEQVGVLRIVRVQNKQAIGRAEGTGAFREGDRVVVQMGDLNIWNGITSVERQLLNKQVLTQRYNAYDTGETLDGDAIRRDSIELNTRAEKMWRKFLEDTRRSPTSVWGDGPLYVSIRALESLRNQYTRELPTNVTVPPSMNRSEYADMLIHGGSGPFFNSLQTRFNTKGTLYSEEANSKVIRDASIRAWLSERLPEPYRSSDEWVATFQKVISNYINQREDTGVVLEVIRQRINRIDQEAARDVRVIDAVRRGILHFQKEEVAEE